MTKTELKNYQIVTLIVIALLFIFASVQSYIYYNHEVKVRIVYLPITFEGEIPYFIDEVGIWNRTINETGDALN